MVDETRISSPLHDLLVHVYTDQKEPLVIHRLCGSFTYPIHRPMTPQQSLNQLCRENHLRMVEQGFWPNLVNTDNSSTVYDFGNKMALTVGELCGEALERIRKGEHTVPDEHCPEFTNLEIELADTMIRQFDLIGGIYSLLLKVDCRIGEAIVAKMTYNQSRPYRHGKLF